MRNNIPWRVSLEWRAVGGDHDAGAVPVAALQVVQHGVGHAVQTVARLLVVGAERFDLNRTDLEVNHQHTHSTLPFSLAFLASPECRQGVLCVLRPNVRRSVPGIVF